MRIGGLATAVLLTLVACGDNGADSSTTATQPPTSTTTTSAPTISTTTIAPTTTASPVAAVPLEIARLDSGLPATFVAVTADWVAVEVDSATGEVVRSIGQLEEQSESDDEAGIFNAIQSIWRTSDGEWYAISTCCEPVAGAIYFIAQDESLNEENRQQAALLDGWTAAPSPFDGRLAKLGFTVDVFEVAGETQASIQPDGAAGMTTGTAAWHIDGRAVSWLGATAGSPSLVTLDLDDPDGQLTVMPLDWVADNQWLQGLGVQASGRFVAFRNTQVDDPEAPRLVATEGVVFDESGLVATFPVELGSFWGGYDPSGRFLLYVDGDGTVRWQGRGERGSLGDGYIQASW